MPLMSSEADESREQLGEEEQRVVVLAHRPVYVALQDL
jgi:hypothetical protein